LDFVETARHYRIIDRTGINVLVPYQKEIFEKLESEARAQGITRSWTARARPHTVSLFEPRREDPLWNCVDAVPVDGKKPSEDWYVCVDPKYYDDAAGLRPPEGQEFLIG